MRKVFYTQTAIGAWAASSTIRTSLERDMLITRITLNARITPSLTFAGAVVPGGLYRCMLNHRILAGGKTFFEGPSTGEGAACGVLFHYLNNEDFGGMPGFPDQQSIAAPDRVFHPVTFVFHCGSRPRLHGVDNPFDLTGCIPAYMVSDLVAEWVTGLNSTMDDGVTLDSGTARYSLHGVIGTHQEILQEMQRQGVMLPRDLPGATGMMPSWVGEVFALDTTYSDYGYSRNIPVGRYLKRLSILCQDATATRPLVANDEVTGLKVSVKLQDVIKVEGEALAGTLRRGNLAVLNDAVELGAGGYPKGLLIADLRAYGHPDYGLNFIAGEASQVGGPKLSMTVTTNASGDDAHFLYEGYVPYYDRLGS